MSLALWEFFWNTSDWAGTVAATSVTFTGPLSGPVGQPSSLFTVGANGAISGTLVVTITNTLGTGTFQPTNVFSLSAGTTTRTFTYTPATLGAHLLSDTNNQALTNAPALPYLATPYIKTGSHKLPDQYESLSDEYWLGRERHLVADFKERNDKFTHLTVLEPNAAVHAAIAELQQERGILSDALGQATDVANLRDIALRIKEIDIEVAALEPDAFVLVKKNIT